MLLALTAILCLFAQASAIAHADFAAHGVCEHGELTEVSDAHAGPPHALARKAPVGFSAATDPAVASLQNVDEHCVVAQLLRQVSPAHAPVLLNRTWLWSEDVVPVTTSALVSRSPLDVSPKQSPPA